jgi:DNA-binding transcriptional regulator YhcF (GntR family)
MDMSGTSTLEREGDLPIATQLVWRLRTLIATGRVRPGERLLPVRELAQRTGVNANTVRAAYQKLEDQGLVVSRQGSGTFVSEGAATSPELAELAAATEAQARSRGIEPRELAAALYLGGDLSSGAAARDAGERYTDDAPERRGRAALRAEIIQLDKDLARLPELPDASEAPDARAARGRQPSAGRLLTADELRTVRDELRARVRAAEAYEDRIRRSIAQRRREVERENAGYVAGAQRPARVRPATGMSTARGARGPLRVAWTGFY